MPLPRTRLLNFRLLLILLMLAGLLASPFTGTASGLVITLGEIIYDNTDGTAPTAFYALEEYGDEIFFKDAPPGQRWVLTDFLFEYYGDFVPQGTERARVRIYLNDGPGRRGYFIPQTLLFESEEMSLDAGYQTKGFSGLNIPLPDHVTWTIEFMGLTQTEGNRAGLLLRPKPTIGKSFRDFWIKKAPGWVVQQILPLDPNAPVDPVTNPDPVENFAARMLGLPDALPAARLTVSRELDEIIVRWTGAGRLQSASEPSGPYLDVAAGTNPYRKKFENSPWRFWRVVQ